MSEQRLIDANKLLETFEKHFDHTKRLVGRRQEAATWVTAKHLLYHTPTVDPVKHGKWGETYYHYGECDFVRDCSECGHPYSQPTRYCPNCGAKMDKEV